MPRFYACDHCGRTGVTFGVVYPNKDVTQPAIRLCQTQDGVQIEPNCYHLVTERGEPLGLRRENAILDSDRHSPRVEATQIRFDQNTQHGLVLSERVQGEHPLIGQPVGETPSEEVVEDDAAAEGLHPLEGGTFLIGEDAEPTDAEKGKGIINVRGADQRPLIDPASEQGTALMDAAAEEEARRIPPNTSGKTFGGDGRFPTPPSDWRSGPTEEFPNRPVREDDDRDLISEGFVKADVTVTHTDGTVVTGFPMQSGYVEEDRSVTEPTGPSPAEIAKAAQEKADAEDAAKASRPEKQGPAARAAKKAPAKKAAAKTPSGTPADKVTVEPGGPSTTSPLAGVPDAQKPQAAAEVAKDQEEAAR